MGTLLRDYHTAQVPSEKKGVTRYTRYSELANENLNTILSTRDYCCDAAYTVAVTVRNEAKYTAQALADKLKKPEFTLSWPKVLSTGIPTSATGYQYGNS